MKNSKEKISIIMASYNYEQFIEEAIESVLNQTYPNWELIIVDDGSKDNSIEIIQKYCEKDSRIKLFQHENAVNKGLKDTILLGLENASSEWISFLESDDIYMPICLEEKIRVIHQDNNTKFIFSDVELLGEEELIRGYNNYLDSREKVLSKDTISYADLFDLNFIPTFSCVMIKKDLLEGCKFDSIIPQNVDWVLWTQLVEKTKFTYIRKKLTKWRKHSKNYMNSLCIDEQNKFTKELLKNLNKNPLNNIFIELHTFLNKKRIEKLLRPQIRAISHCICHLIIGQQYIEITKIKI